jgi:hypothetical protein
MRVNHILICLLSTVLFYSCSGDKKDGKEKDGLVKHYDAMGKLVQEANYKNGRLNGLVTDYYKNGKVLQEVNYVNDIKHGIAKKYYEDGTLSRVTPYDSGIVDGIEYKYRKDGKPISEAIFDKGNPCIGLVEYLPDGSLKTKYPRIVVTPVDDMLRKDKYMLRVELSDGTKAVKWYLGKLTDGKYIGREAQDQWSVKNGVLTLEYYVPSGSFIMERINIIAVVKTFHNNDYITQYNYNISAENR